MHERTAEHWPRQQRVDTASNHSSAHMFWQTVNVVRNVPPHRHLSGAPVNTVSPWATHHAFDTSENVFQYRAAPSLSWWHRDGVVTELGVTATTAAAPQVDSSGGFAKQCSLPIDGSDRVPPARMELYVCMP